MKAEETKDASRVVPTGMMWTVILNGSTGFIMVLTFCFCIGNIEDALNTPSGQPYIQVFLSATGSYAGATVMAALIIFMTLCATIGVVAAASRQMFAFARDRGLPFASFLSHVSTCHDMINTYCLTVTEQTSGQTRLGRPPQRPLRLLHPQLPPRPHQHGQLRRLQRHNLPHRSRSPLFLHNIHFLHPTKTPAW